MADAPEPRRAPRAQRLGRSLRLRAGRDFHAVFAARRRSRSGPLLVFGRPNGLEFARLGLSVGRGVGGSVQRHRLKRLLREAFRTTRGQLPSGYDWLVVASPHELLSVEEYRHHLRRAASAVARSSSQSSSRDQDEPEKTA